MLRERVQRLSALCYGLICAAGCFYQIKSVTDTFFNYAINTQVRVELPSTLPLPALSVCFRISDIFNYDRYGQSIRLDAEVEKSIGKNGTTVDQMNDLMTIADTFKYTPSNKLMVSCVFRKPKSYDLHAINGSDCLQYFNVTNFYLQEYLCYRIRLVKFESQDYNYRSAAFALSHAGILYSVSYNVSTFKKAMFMKIILNEYDSRPFRSSAYTSPVARLYNPQTELGRYNYFTLTYYVVRNHFLPAPYRTKCVDYEGLGIMDAEDCIKKCLKASSLDAFDRFPYSVLETEALSDKIFTIGLLKRNATVTKLLYRYERKCQSKCKQVGCTLSYTITQVTKDPNNDLMTFNIMIPQLPSYTIKFRPRMQFIEYFIYVLSCFGTWFGLSVLSLNPFQKKIWLSDSEHTDPDIRLKRTGDRSVDVMKKQSEMYDKCCVYCSQTRIMLISETRERVRLLMHLMSSFKKKSHASK